MSKSASKHPLPYIAYDDVERALKELGYSAVEYPDNPLHHLLIVDLALSAPPVPKGDRSRAYIFNKILINCIEQKLSEVRARFGLPAPPTALNTNDAQWNQEDFQQAAVSDGQQNSKKLLAWSLLYHCYVRAELELTPPMFSAWIGTGIRNVNRFRQYAVKCLTDALTEEEYRARLKERKKRLRSVLPFSRAVKIFGRDDILASTCNRIEVENICHIYISGAAGVGKTALAQAISERLIDNERVDEAIWIDAPTSVMYIRQYVAERIVPEGVFLSLRDLMMSDHQRTLIVCDGVEQLLESQKLDLEILLREWDSAIIVITSRAYAVMNPIGDYVQLGGLSWDAASEYLCHLMHKMGHPCDSELIESIIEELGTNPRALQDAVTHLETESWARVRQIVHHGLFAETFDAVHKNIQLAWCVYALYPDGCGSLEQIRSFWTPSIDENVIAELRRRFVIEVQSDQDVYRLKDEALHFIRAAYKDRGDVREVIDALGQHIHKQVLQNPQGAFYIAQQLLMSDWIEIPDAHRVGWINCLWQEGIKQGYASKWRVILEPMQPYDNPNAFEIRLAYGLCLRRLGEWETADAIFERLVRDCGSGKHPDFVAQARALFEQSIVAHYGGHYERAQDLLRRSEMAATRLHDNGLLARVHIEKAHIALERQQYGEANLILGDLPMSPRVALLMSEAALGQRDISACRQYIDRGFNLVAQDLGIQAALYNVLGRSYELEENYVAASQCFKLSIVRLERVNDVDGLARIRGNLGVALMRSGEYHDAGTVLEQAEGDLSQLGDVVAVAAVRHNRRILYNLIAPS